MPVGGQPLKHKRPTVSTKADRPVVPTLADWQEHLASPVMEEDAAGRDPVKAPRDPISHVPLRPVNCLCSVHPCRDVQFKFLEDLAFHIQEKHGVGYYKKPTPEGYDERNPDEVGRPARGRE